MGLFYRESGNPPWDSKLTLLVKGLFVPKGQDGAELRSFDGRPKPGQNPHQRRKKGSQKNGAGSDNGRPTGKFADNQDDDPAQYDSYGPAQDSDGHGLDEELGKYVQAPGTDGFSQADFTGTLGDRYQHNVHDSDTAHQKRDGRDGRQQNGHDLGGGAQGGLDIGHVAHLEGVLVAGQVGNVLELHHEGVNRVGGGARILGIVRLNVHRVHVFLSKEAVHGGGDRNHDRIIPVLEAVGT